MDPTQDVLRHFLSYDPTTGVFTRIRAGHSRHADKVGKPCGSVNKHLGYVEIYVDGAKHNAHRLAWIYVHGYIPEGMRPDHENRVRHDNRLGNLRLATHAQNMQNCKLRVDNTSGIKGVSFDTTRGKWAAAVGRRKLGRFDTREEAAAARTAAALAAFGEFATDRA